MMGLKAILKIVMPIIAILVPLGFEVSGYENIGLAILCWGICGVAILVTLILCLWPRLPWGLQMMEWFPPIKVMRSSLFIDTHQLRRFISKQKVESTYPILDVIIEVMLVSGYGGLDNEIKLEFNEDIREELKSIVTLPKTLHITETNEPIELKVNIPKSFHLREELPLIVAANKDLSDKLDDISMRIEEGNYKIIYKTTMGRRLWHKPSRIKRGKLKR